MALHGTWNDDSTVVGNAALHAGPLRPRGRTPACMSGSPPENVTPPPDTSWKIASLARLLDDLVHRDVASVERERVAWAGVDALRRMPCRRRG